MGHVRHLDKPTNGPIPQLELTIWIGALDVVAIVGLVCCLISFFSREQRTMMFRPANPGDVPRISALLDTVKLPTQGVADHIDTFAVSESDGAIIGVGGLEIHGAQALLRSLAVSPAHQGRGLATALCDHLEAEAARRGIQCVYLLTETAEQFFMNRGYAAASRPEAPPEIAASEEFSAICPQSAVFMRRAV